MKNPKLKLVGKTNKQIIDGLTLRNLELINELDIAVKVIEKLEQRVASLERVGFHRLGE